MLAYNDTSVTVGWDAPSPSHGDIIEFRVTYKSENDDVEKSVRSDASTGTFKAIGNLQPATTYYFYVSVFHFLIS